MNGSYSSDQRITLLEVAEDVIRHAAANERRFKRPADDLGEWAFTPRATFVTVYLEDKLNGCIGTLDARRGVVEDVAYNAHRAAFHDPRFSPIHVDVLDALSVHVSVLGELRPFEVADEMDLLSKMRVGVDGIILEDGDRRGTFLPSVWEKLPSPEDFLLHLKLKAGLHPDEWPRSLNVYRFEVESFDRETLA